MSVNAPLLDTIEPDDPTDYSEGTVNKPKQKSQPIILNPTNHASSMANTQEDAESGIASIFRQESRSAHPIALFVLYLFRIAAIGVYIFSGLFTANFVLTAVMVVVLLSMDFWNCRNVAGRTLVGLRFWNQVDEDGESFWVFESRDPSRPPNPIDSKMFWIAIYMFPVLWGALLIISLLKLGFSFIPIVLLALVFNITNAVGFTYADRDAKQRWANNVMGSAWGIGGFGGQLLTSVVQRGVGRVFGN